jgi:hypothetical protein
MISQAKLRDIDIRVVGLDERDETIYSLDKLRLN